MCGRYFLDASLQELEQVIGPLSARIKLAPRYNIAPEQPVPVIRDSGKGHELTLMRWGLIPGWSKGPDRRYSMFNARAETLNEKPAFKSAYRYRRCILPASGFYEWRAAGRAPKQPFAIRRHDRKPMLLAGLWEHWQSAEGSELESCSIVVTRANQAMAGIHDRMPVILQPQQIDHWLDSHHQSTRDLAPWLEPCESRLLELYPVDPAVGSVSNDNPGLIDPVPNDSLF